MVIQSLNNNLEFESDRIRLDYLKNPTVSFDANIAISSLERYVPSVKELYATEDLVVSVDFPKYVAYFELWEESCKDAFIQKYGDDDPDLIVEKMTPRMRNIGNMLNLKLIKFEYISETDIMKCIFEKEKI